jgi:hypothetical protein
LLLLGVDEGNPGYPASELGRCRSCFAFGTSGVWNGRPQIFHMSLFRKRRDQPEYPLETVRSLANAGKLFVEPRALISAIEILPYEDPRPSHRAREEIAYIIERLVALEFEFRQEIPDRTPADVYRVNWEEMDLYIKLKIESNIEVSDQQVVTVLSFKPWTD